jgi:hypothetical protein
LASYLTGRSIPDWLKIRKEKESKKKEKKDCPANIPLHDVEEPDSTIHTLPKILRPILK